MGRRSTAANLSLCSHPAGVLASRFLASVALRPPKLLLGSPQPSYVLVLDPQCHLFRHPIRASPSMRMGRSDFTALLLVAHAERPPVLPKFSFSPRSLWDSTETFPAFSTCSFFPHFTPASSMKPWLPRRLPPPPLVPTRRPLR